MNIAFNLRHPDEWRKAITMMARYLGGKIVLNEQRCVSQDQSRLVIRTGYVCVVTVRGGDYRSLRWFPR